MNMLTKILVALLALFAFAEAHAMRWYSPNTGRWFSRDPIGEEGGENIYAAFNNSPTYNIDLFGLSSCQSDYRWIIHPPMRDRDLQAAQVITGAQQKESGKTLKLFKHKHLSQGFGDSPSLSHPSSVETAVVLLRGRSSLFLNSLFTPKSIC